MRLIAEKLGGERGGQPVFSAIDIDLGEGESLVVTGPNGSGKSTLLRVIAGLLPQSSGSVRLEEGGDEFPSVASASHYVGHLNAMKPALTVTENLCFWRDFCGAPGVDPAEALERVELGTVGHLPYGYLSTGQRRRVSLAKLLVSRRPIWLLDEPSAGLDKASEQRLTELMEAHLDDGGLLVAATHLPLGVAGAQRLEMREV
jgi:heme exporter protein A